MNRIKHLCLFGTLFLFTYLPINAQDTLCIHPDYDALSALYNATNGDNWTQKWDLSDCDVCSWIGVGCDPLTKRVDVIFLADNNLTGKIPPEIGEIRNLLNLNLSSNQLSGIIPTEIENLTPVLGFITGLRFLSLDNNQLSGPIPEAIGKLSGGSILDLSNNNFTGPIPDNLADFGNLVNLNILRINLDNNQLSGCYPNNLDKFCPGDAFVAFSALGNIDLPNGGDFSMFCESSQGACIPNELMGCDALQFISQVSSIKVSGLTELSKVEIIGRNTGYQTILICEDDCSVVQTIEDLETGEYTVKVNLFDGENYCYREASVMVEGYSTNNGNGSANCENLIFTGEEGQITVDGLTASNNKVEILGQNTDWQVVTICDGDCSPTQIIPDLAAGEYAVKINQSGSDGSYCFREEKISVTDGGNMNGGNANCENLIFSSSNDTIIVDGLTADYNKVEILGRNTDWQVLTICDGDCSDTQFIPDLAAGEYSVKMNQGGNDGSYCYREEQIHVESSSDSRNSVIDFGSDLVLYPNPARDKVHLQFTSLSEKDGNIRIYNTFGQAVQSIPITRFEGNSVSVDLNGYENGVYLMTIQVGQLPLVSRRFVVEHLR